MIVAAAANADHADQANQDLTLRGSNPRFCSVCEGRQCFVWASFPTR